MVRVLLDRLQPRAASGRDQDWSDKYKGKFDQGWDKLREETFERQKERGVIPADAELTPRPEAMPAWDSLDANHQRLYARQMEVYAGYCENADWNIGRVIDAIDEMGELENTLVIYIWGDNGASMEGTLTGTFNELTTLNGVPLTDEQQLQLTLKWGGLEAWGTDMMGPHYSAAWAWAGNCPFQWGKQVASHLGGTRDPMVVHWPKRDRRAGRAPPAVHARHRRRPDHPRGGGFAAADPHRRRRAAADARNELPLLARRRGRRRAAHAAVLRDPRQPGDVQGRLVARVDDAAHPVGARPRDAGAVSRPASGIRRPIRSSSTTFRTTSPRRRTVADQHPEKVEELKKLFWEEAERYDVFPLLGGLTGFFGMRAADPDAVDSSPTTATSRTSRPG
mgnify:CR=1 FL=1